MNALLPIVEGGSAGDDEEQAGETARVDLVEELAQRVEGLLADVAAHSLQGLHLVEDEQQPGVPAVPEDGEQALQEAEGAEVVEVAADSGGALGGGGHGLLSAEPGDERLCAGAVAVCHGPAIAAQRRGEGRGGAGDGGEPVFEEFVDRGCQGLLVVVRDGAAAECLLLQGVEPGVDDGTQGGGLVGGGGEAFGEPAVDGLQAVQRGLGLGDLHLADGQSAAFGAFGEPPGEERFTGSVFAAQGVEGGSAAGDGRQVVVEGGLEAVQADGEQAESRLRYGAAPQGVDDVASACGADVGCRVGHAVPSGNCCWSSALSSWTVRPDSTSWSTG